MKNYEYTPTIDEKLHRVFFVLTYDQVEKQTIYRDFLQPIYFPTPLQLFFLQGGYVKPKYRIVCAEAPPQKDPPTALVGLDECTQPLLGKS